MTDRDGRLWVDPGYPLSELTGCELVFCNKFEWGKRIISWAGWKKLLEGESVLVALPKNGGKDQLWKGDAPVIGSTRRWLVSREIKQRFRFWAGWEPPASRCGWLGGLGLLAWDPGQSAPAHLVFEN